MHAMRARFRLGAIVVAALVGLGAGARAGEPVVGAPDPDALFHSADPRLEANKSVVYHLLKDVVQSGRPDLAPRYLSDRFIEHDPAAAPLRRAKARHGPVARRLQAPVVAVLAEGDYVVVARPRTVGGGSGGPSYTTTWFDMWRVLGGKVVEHWSVATLADAPSVRSIAEPVVGAPDADALFHIADPRLDANKQLAYHFIKDIVEAGHWADLTPVYATERYIQHNPNVPTGRDAAIKLFAEQLKMPVTPIADRLKMKITAVVAEGDYVAVILPRPVADPMNPARKFTTAWIDMWKVRDGKADEHWDPSLRDEHF